MLEHTFVRTGVIAWLRRSPLGPHLDHFATSLHHEGYASSSIQRFLCATEKLAQWLQGHGYAVCEMKTFYERISLGSRDTVAGTGPKQPRGLATSSDSSANTASHVPGKTGFPLHLSISGYAPMMPILSTRHRDRQNRQPSARRAARERPRGPHDLQRSFATRS